jgi:hypothetical protein
MVVHLRVHKYATLEEVSVHFLPTLMLLGEYYFLKAKAWYPYFQEWKLSLRLLGG